MDIAEMHVWFRQYAQQMGMQNTRAILPEQIDLVINTSITDVVNQVITQNIGATNDRIITDNSKIGQINALRSLYKVLVTDIDLNDTNTGIFNWGDETSIRKIFAKIDYMVGPIKYWRIVPDPNGHYYAAPIEKSDYDDDNDKVSTELLEFDYFDKTYVNAQNQGKVARTAESFDYLYLVDLSMNYIDTNKTGSIKTNYFPVRLIDDIYLADTLNDFILAPKLRSPIAVLYNKQLDVYIDTEDNILNYNLVPNQLRVSYISKPAKVRYATDLGGQNVNCDLPEYMHVDILKHAVDLYRVAVSGGMYGAQQQQQAQNREIARNTARPDNEGYQS